MLKKCLAAGYWAYQRVSQYPTFRWHWRLELVSPDISGIIAGLLENLPIEGTEEQSPEKSGYVEGIERSGAKRPKHQQNLF